MLCGFSGKSLFPEGPTELECQGCGAMIPAPWEREEVTEEQAEDICYGRGITLDDLLK
jgi:hypothetical protein